MNASEQFVCVQRLFISPDIHTCVKYAYLAHKKTMSSPHTSLQQDKKKKTLTINWKKIAMIKHLIIWFKKSKKEFLFTALGS